MPPENQLTSGPDSTREGGQRVESLLGEVGVDVSSNDAKKLFEQIKKDKPLEQEVVSSLQIVKNNPLEKGRFEQYYIVGSREAKMKNGTIMNFRDILNKSMGGEDLSKKIEDEDLFDEYAEWRNRLGPISTGVSLETNSVVATGEAKVATGEAKVATGEAKVAESNLAKNEIRIEKILALNTQLEKINTSIANSITPIGTAIIDSKFAALKTEAGKDTQSNPTLTKLQEKGITPEMVQSGKYDNIVRSYIILENKVDLAKNIKQGQEKEFQSAITTLSLNLGYPLEASKGGVAELGRNIELGPNKEKVTNKLESLVSTGEYKTMSWDRDTRQIRLEAKDGTTRVIDTALIPPRERIVRNGLSIDQAIPNESKESVQYKKTVQGIQEKQKKNEDEIGENSKKLSGIVLDEKNPIIKDKEKLGTVALLEERGKQYGKIKTSEGKTEEKIAAITELLRINQEIKGKNLNQIMSEGDIDVSKLNSQLESEGELLNKLKKSLNTRIELEKTSALNEKNKPKDVRDNFESIAKSNLSFLIDLGYDKIGQQTLDKVVASLNAEYKGVNGDSSYVDLSREELDSQQKQRILLGLTRLMHVNGRGLMPEWDHVNNDDQFIAYRQTRSPLWNVSLQNLGKKPEYQFLVNNTDITKFRNQVIGREKPPEKPAEAPK